MLLLRKLFDFWVNSRCQVLSIAYILLLSILQNFISIQYKLSLESICYINFNHFFRQGFYMDLFINNSDQRGPNSQDKNYKISHPAKKNQYLYFSQKNNTQGHSNSQAVCSETRNRLFLRYLLPCFLLVISPACTKATVTRSKHNVHFLHICTKVNDRRIFEITASPENLQSGVIMYEQNPRKFEKIHIQKLFLHHKF